MLIDIYGSRSNLINVLNTKDSLNLAISNVFIGTSIESQLFKEIPLDEERMEQFTSPYEVIEINTDFRKRLRRHNEFPKSNVILLDFMHEGRQSIKYKRGSMVNRPVLRRYGYSLGNGKLHSLDTKVNDIDKYVDALIDYISSYELVIINKMRNPKLSIDEYGNAYKKENFDEINFLNFYAATFEETLLAKLDKVEVIPEYSSTDQLKEGYQYKDEYQEYFKEKMKEILSQTTVI